MKRTFFTLLLAGFSCAAAAQKPAGKAATQAAPQPAGSPSALADALAERLGQELRVKTVIGEPVKAGAVTLIPILMVDVNFAGVAAPAPTAGGPGINGFLISGEARPVGFVAVTKQGTRFINCRNASQAGKPQ